MSRPSSAVNVMRIVPSSVLEMARVSRAWTAIGERGVVFPHAEQQRTTTLQDTAECGQQRAVRHVLDEHAHHLLVARAGRGRERE